MTNVKASQLNYDKYTASKYDQDIVNSIPFHREIHTLFIDFIASNFKLEDDYQLLDIGVGTGITSRLVKDQLPNSSLEVIDFSEQMLKGAKEKLGNEAEYLLADYSDYEFEDRKYDLVFSFIGLHHQNEEDSFEGSEKMFEKIYKMLKKGGVFVLGDLMTYKDLYDSALNHAKHYALLVEKATDEQTLREWAHHHMYLNHLAPIEDQMDWLADTGFQVEKAFHKMNTGLLICKKI